MKPPNWVINGDWFKKLSPRGIERDLRYADLKETNLIGANLTRADLSDADLSGSNLSGIYLTDTIVENAKFVGVVGLSPEAKLNLKQRGAILD